jgi:hypothetical protein
MNSRPALQPVRAYFSFRTPLKGSPPSFWSMISPVVRFLLAQLPLGARNWERSFTAPTRPGPLGGFLANANHPLPPPKIDDGCPSPGGPDMESGTAAVLWPLSLG